MYNAYIIGNGFSINVVNMLIEKKLIDKEAIDLKNLFSQGDVVPCPDGTRGYLSAQYCPFLWNIGARSYVESSESTRIISNIICSYNVYQSIAKQDDKAVIEDCQKGYFELNRYLRNLFAYYNSLISDDSLRKILDNLPLIDKIDNSDVIISYNYDVLIERLLSVKLNKPIQVKKSIKYVGDIAIVKPHGSIDFELSIDNVDLSKLYNYNISYLAIDLEFKYPHNNLCGPALIIPPLGHIKGSCDSWVDFVRSKVKEYLISSPQNVVFYGLSYDPVDRSEINEIISYIDRTASVTYINPLPAPELDFIFSQHFKSYKHLCNERKLQYGKLES